jgi:phosphoenolpyruvate carboxykinase (GTP)
LWPGYGENSRVLKWIFDRLDGKANATKTAIGYLPSPADIDVSGLNVTEADMNALLSIDSEGWKSALPQMRDHYAQFGAKLPAPLTTALDELESSLK